MSMTRWSSALAAAPIAALLLTGAAAAQEPATPAAEEEEAPARLVLPEECEAPAAAAPDVAAQLTGDAQFVGPTLAVPLGEPADPESALLINDTARQVLACLNGNDFLRLGSLTTPAGAKLLLAGLAAQAGDGLEARLAEAPVARQDEGLIRLIAVTDPTILADGRLAAFVVINEPTNLVRGPETFMFVFARDGESLRLDGLFGFSVAPPPAPDATPEAGTPTP